MFSSERNTIEEAYIAGINYACDIHEKNLQIIRFKKAMTKHLDNDWNNITDKSEYGTHMILMSTMYDKVEEVSLHLYLNNRSKQRCAFARFDAWMNFENKTIIVFPTICVENDGV